METRIVQSTLDMKTWIHISIIDQDNKQTQEKKWGEEGTNQETSFIIFEGKPLLNPSVQRHYNFWQQISWHSRVTENDNIKEHMKNLIQNTKILETV